MTMRGLPATWNCRLQTNDLGIPFHIWLFHLPESSVICPDEKHLFFPNPPELRILVLWKAQMRQGLETIISVVCIHAHIYIYTYIYKIYYILAPAKYIYIYICPQSIYLYINDSIRIYIYFLPVYLSIFVEELWRTGHFKPGHHGCSGSALQNEPHPRIFFSWATIIFLKAACISR